MANQTNAERVADLLDRMAEEIGVRKELLYRLRDKAEKLLGLSPVEADKAIHELDEAEHLVIEFTGGLLDTVWVKLKPTPRDILRRRVDRKVRLHVPNGHDVREVVNGVMRLIDNDDTGYLKSSEGED